MRIEIKVYNKIIKRTKTNMYLPTFWKLTTEATFYRLRHISGYGVPVGALGKSNTPKISKLYIQIYILQSFLILNRLIYRYMDIVPITLQLCLFMHYSTKER